LCITIRFVGNGQKEDSEGDVDGRDVEKIVDENNKKTGTGRMLQFRNL
jgi:hypothetical protein